MDILNRWERLLLNNLDEYCWASVASSSPSKLVLNDPQSLVYVPKNKRHGEYYFSAYRKISYPIFYLKY